MTAMSVSLPVKILQDMQNLFTFCPVRQIIALAPHLQRPFDSSVVFIRTCQRVPIAEHGPPQRKKEILKLLTRFCGSERRELAADAAILNHECDGASIDLWHSVYKWSVMKSAKSEKGKESSYLLYTARICV